MKPANYTIQDWLFTKAEGRFDIDLAESGIQYHHLHDLHLDINYDLNYSLDAGKCALRQCISKLYRKNQENVIVTHGAQEALYLFYRSFLQTNDHVITFSPGWQQSWEIPHIIGAHVEVISLTASQDYEISIEVLKKSINPKTKLIILTNPGNPTSKQLTHEIGEALLKLCKRHNIFLLVDEEYFIDYPNSFVNRYEQCAIVSSLSKIYGFPGLRTGWLVGPGDIINDLINYKRYITVSNSSLCEYLAIQVLEHYTDYLAQYQTLISKRMPIIRNWVQQYQKLCWHEPNNTPFVYVSFNDQTNSQDFCERLLEKFRVLIMPAEVFCDKSALRISFGRPVDILKKGLKALSQLM